MSAPVHDTATTIALATYAATRLEPLIARIPGACMQITCYLGDPAFNVVWSVDVVVNRRGVTRGEHLAAARFATTTDYVDLLINKIRAIAEQEAGAAA